MTQLTLQCNTAAALKQQLEERHYLTKMLLRLALRRVALWLLLGGKVRSLTLAYLVANLLQ